MATTSVDGQSYTLPDNGDRGWGTEVSNLLGALGDNSLLIKGGSIPLTSEADFGVNFGIKSLYYKSTSADIALGGVVRLATNDAVSWRNTANSGNLDLSVNGSDLPTFNAIELVNLSASQTLSNKSMDASTNTFTNIDTTNLAAGILITSTTLVGAADTNFPSTLAVKSYIDTQTGNNTPTSRLLTAGNGLSGGGDLSADRTFTVNVDDSTVEIVTDTIQVKDSGIVAAKLATDSVETLKIKDVNVTAAKLATDSVETLKIKDANVTAAKLATDSVETLKIKDSNVTGAKLEDNIDLPGSEAVGVPAGATGSRPGTPAAGDFRFNTTSNTFEGYDGTVWDDIPGSGGGASQATPTVLGTVTSYESNIVSGNTTVGNATFTFTPTDGFNTLHITAATASSDKAITLPLAADSTNRTITIYRDVDPASNLGHNIKEHATDGGATLRTLYAKGFSTWRCNGTDWFEIGHREYIDKDLDGDFSGGGPTCRIVKEFSKVLILHNDTVVPDHSSSSAPSTNNDWAPKGFRPPIAAHNAYAFISGAGYGLEAIVSTTGYFGTLYMNTGSGGTVSLGNTLRSFSITYHTEE